MASPAINIEKLNAYNYASWSADMKFVLLERNAWDIIEGTEEVPVSSDTDDRTKEINDFNHRKRIALSLIYLFIEPEFRKIIESYDDPVKSWKRLKSHFYPDNRSRHMSLFTELMNCRIEASEKVDLYAARLRRIYDRMTSIDKNFSELYLCFQFLRYLPSEYDGIVQTILRLPDKDFKFESIVLDIVAEETRITLREQDLNASFSASQLTFRKPQSRQKVTTCFKCGKSGHWKKDCRSRTQDHHDRSNRGRPSRQRTPSPDKDDHPVPRQQRFNSKSYGNQRTSICKSFNFYVTQANIGEMRTDSGNWVFDTAASHHFCSQRELFTNFISLKNQQMAVAVQGASFPIEGKGKVLLKFGSRTVRLNNVMYSSKLRRNLISGPKLDTHKAQFVGGKGVVNVSDPGGAFVFKAVLRNGVYEVTPDSPNKNIKKVRFQASAVKADELGKWHKRFGHINAQTINKTSKLNCVHGLPRLDNANLQCEECKINKFRRVSFKPINYIRSKRPLELLYADVWGPCPTRGRGGERYFLSIIDDLSRKVSIYPLRDKSQVPEVLKKQIVRAERFLGLKVKAVRTDNGGEFLNRNFSSFCDNSGIKHELTNTFSPEQNGTIERFNQTIADGARTILSESGLDKSFWPEAMSYFSYTWNRLCHGSQTKTPFELYCGNRPSVRHMRAFGTLAYLGVPKQLRHKLDAKAKKGVMVGYAFKTKGYRIWIPDENRVVETINVNFREDSFYKSIGKVVGSGAVLGTTMNWSPTPVPEEEIPEREDIDDVPLTESPGRPSTSRELTSREEEGDSSEDEVTSNLRKVTWIRKAVRRPDGSRTDIYYYEQGKGTRLRSPADVKVYCSKHNILYNEQLFNFRGNDKFEGEVVEKPVSSNFTET